ncbi:disulfide bond formation protein DsbA, partial [bacterium]
RDPQSLKALIGIKGAPAAAPAGTPAPRPAAPPPAAAGPKPT